MFKVRNTVFLGLFLGFFIQVNAQNRLYEDPSFPAIARQHKIIAILPFDGTVSLRPKQMESLSEEQIQRMGKDEGYNIQQSMYSWFLTRRQRGEMTIDVQNPIETNALLEKSNTGYFALSTKTPRELAEILGVDAVIMGSFETSKPMSEGASVALGLLIGFWGNTDKAVMNMFIYNGEDGKTLFNYHRAINGSIGTNADNLINKLMRKSSRKIAYTTN